MIPFSVHSALLFYSPWGKPDDLSSSSLTVAADGGNFKNFLLIYVFSVWRSRSWGCYPSKDCFYRLTKSYGRNVSEDVLSCCPAVAKTKLVSQTCYSVSQKKSSVDLEQTVLSDWLQRFLPWHSVSSLCLQFEIGLSQWACILCCLECKCTESRQDCVKGCC